MSIEQWITIAGITAPIAVGLCGVAIQLLIGLHRQMNSRLDEMVTVRVQAAHAEGVLQGLAQKDEIRAMVKEQIAEALKQLPVVPVVISQLPPSTSGPTIPPTGSS